MSRPLAVVVMASAGGIVAMQPAMNSQLGKVTGALPAALMSFLIGAVVLAAIVIATGQAGALTSGLDVHWYYLLGGVFGALWITTSLIAIDSLGAGGVVAATITGQLTGSVILDRLGVLGLEQVPISPSRVLGVMLLVLGTFLIVR
jgi:bacterial/archaeal transporter family-2 protein